MSVEFTAHTTRSFMLAVGTRSERVQEALDAMFVPILSGSFSTFLGISALAFAEFPYFRIYFFYMYMLFILIGTFNGLIVLPAILCVVGK